MACRFLNSSTFRDAPTDRRKTCASKGLFFLGFMLDVWTAVSFDLASPSLYDIAQRNARERFAWCPEWPQIFVLQAPYSGVSTSLLKMSFENRRQDVGIRATGNFIGNLLDRVDC